MILIDEALRTRTAETDDASGLIPSNAVVLVANAPPDTRGGTSAWGGLLASAPERVGVLDAGGPEESVVLQFKGRSHDIRLRQCDELFSILGTDCCYLDISGLPLRVWAPIVRDGMTSLSELTVVYAEPREYRRHHTPTSTAFDLSARVGRIRPIPGFAKLSPHAERSEVLLVAFLGFEGGRAKHIAAQFDPIPRTVPVIGVPGYRPEFLQHALRMNAAFLGQTDSHPYLRMAAADSPFAAKRALSEAVRMFTPNYTLIAPIGTRPHALGALLYCLEHWDECELYYDHPTPQTGRSKGIERINLYRVKP